MAVLARPTGEAPIARALRPGTKSVTLTGLRGVADVDLAPLSGCPALTSLTIDGSFSTPGGLDLAPLSGCPALASLTIDSDHLDTLDLAPLASLRGLLTLQLRTQHAVDLAPLAGIPLRRLTLICQDWSRCDLSALADSGDLRQLSVTLGAFRALDLAPLAGHPGLQRLTISTTQLRALDLAPLAGLSRLRRLSLAGNRWMKASLDPLTGSRIAHLDCSRSPRLTLSASLGEVALLQALSAPVRRT